MEQKKLSYLPYLLILPLLFFSTIAKADDVNNFLQFQAALINPLVSEINVTADEIVFGNNIIKLITRTFDMKSSAPAGFSELSGNSTYKGLSFSANSNISFENIIFNDFKTNDPGSSTEQNFGGALNLNRSAASFSATTSFTGNKANKGGAIYAIRSSNLFFNSAAAFTGNESYNAGAAIYLNNSQAVFADTANFSQNVSKAYGGGFYADEASTVSFKGTAYFSNNEATLYGAGFYTNKSSVSFEGIADIRLNRSNNMGGGFLSDNSTIIFDANTIISSNSSVYSGGGFLANNLSNIFFNNDVEISSNSSSSGSGGGFRANNSKILFTNTSAISSFYGNNASHGGSFSANFSTITFNSEALFEMNYSSNSGGAIYATDGSILFFNGKSSFKYNSSISSGGAISVTKNSFISFGNEVIFSSNTSGKGGSLYIESSSASLLNPKFYNNKSNAAGGAIYLEGTPDRYASIDIKATSGEQAVFKGNQAKGLSNALYIGSYSKASFQAQSGASIEMYDGFNGSAANTSFIFSGEGDFNFYGDSSGNKLNMTLAATNGGAFNIKPGALFMAAKLTNNAGSIFNMSNDAEDIIILAALDNSGTLSFDALASGNSDKIYVSGDVKLSSSSSKLELNSDISNKNFKKIIYTLIHYDGIYSGTFADFVFNSSVTFSTSPLINYGDIFPNWITVTLYGGEDKTNFASIPGLNFNQVQVAKTFDYLSDKSSGELDIIMGRIEGFDIAGKKKALQQSSGYFLANVIKNVAAENESSYIFHKINAVRKVRSKDNKVWAQYIGNALTFSEDKNSPKDYQDTSNGIMLGFDTVIEDQITAGFYGKYLNHNVNQNPENSAELNSTGLGFYTGYKDLLWDFKALIFANFNENNTQRFIPFLNKKTKASFNSKTLGFDFEGATSLNFTMFSYIRPFAGFELRNVSYKGFTERGAGALNLNVDGDNYFRSAFKLGASINYDARLYSYFLGVETKYLISGDANIIESSFDKTNVSFKSKSSTEGRLVLGASAGAMIKIIKDVHIFVNADIFKAEQYENLHANIGIRYSFNTPAPSSKSYSFPFNKKLAPDNNLYAPPPPGPSDDGIVSSDNLPIGEDLFQTLLP